MGKGEETEERLAVRTQALEQEICASRLILCALIEGLLPSEPDKAFAEIETMVARVGELAAVAKIGGFQAEALEELRRRAAISATAFLRSIGGSIRPQ